MSATPTLNNSNEMYSIFSMLFPAVKLPLVKFGRLFNHNFGGSELLLHEFMSNYTLRRKKEDIIQLPLKTKTQVHVSIEERAAEEIAIKMENLKINTLSNIEFKKLLKSDVNVKTLY